MAKDEDEEEEEAEEKGDEGREVGFGFVRNVEGGRRRGGGACGEPERCLERG